MRHTPYLQYSSPSGQCIFLETSPNSCNSVFPNLCIVFLDSSLDLLDLPFSLKAALRDSVGYLDRSLSTISWILLMVPWSSSTASCGIPWILRWTLNGFSSSATGFPVRIGVPWFCSVTGFPVLNSVFCYCCCCCCCFSFQTSLRTIFGTRRGVETLLYNMLSAWRLSTFLMQSAGTESSRIMARDLVWQNFIRFSCALTKWIQQTTSWWGFHSLWQCTFLVSIHLCWILFWFLPRGSNGVVALLSCPFHLRWVLLVGLTSR